VLAGLWLVLHVCVVAVSPVADGFADHSDAVVQHIEDADGGECPTSHGDLCELCHFAHGLRALEARGADVCVPAATPQVRAPATAVALPTALEFLDGRSSRAPPALG
jgi:hypothetical protein